MLYVIFGILGLLGMVILIAMFFRTVVATNEVHIVQSSDKTTPYGKGFPNGAVYYKWPSWIPKIGLKTIVLPVSVFVIDLVGYNAYDNGKVPFVVDIKAWFRTDKADTAAQRIEDFQDLKTQLDDVLRGAVRKILASYDIEKIMETRVELVEDFKREVTKAANEFGVVNVNIEFMDIRDPDDDSSRVIDDIMEKKKTLIEKESRMEIAENKKEARIKEISAQQEGDVREQEALEIVGQRSAEKDQRVGVAQEKAQQEIQLEARTTKERQMEVLKVQEVKKAEIVKQAEIVKSEEIATKAVIEAEGQRKKVEQIAIGNKNAEKERAEGVTAIGLAEGEAEKAIQLAPVEAQIELAKAVASLPEYQAYLLGVEQIKADKEVGLAKAQALTTADLKILVNSGEVTGGVNNLMDILGTKGGVSIAQGLEAMKQFPAGKAMYEKIFPEEKEEVIEATDNPKLSDNIETD